MSEEHSDIVRRLREIGSRPSSSVSAVANEAAAYITALEQKLAVLEPAADSFHARLAEAESRVTALEREMDAAAEAAEIDGYERGMDDGRADATAATVDLWRWVVNWLHERGAIDPEHPDGVTAQMILDSLADHEAYLKRTAERQIAEAREALDYIIDVSEPGLNSEHDIIRLMRARARRALSEERGNG